MQRYFLLGLVGAWLLAAGDGAAQTPTREKAIADFYWRTGHPQSAMFYVQLQEKRDKKEAPKEPPTQATPLEQLIAEALRNNPDLRVADANVRKAEAEYYRTRTRVITELQGVLAEIEGAESGASLALSRYEASKKLFEGKTISREDLAAAYLSYVKLKSELVGKQTQLPYLLGRETGSQAIARIVDESIRKAWDQNVNDAKITDDEFMRRSMLDILGRLPVAEEISKFRKRAEDTRRRIWLDELLQAVASPVELAKTPAKVDTVGQSRVPDPSNPLTDRLRKALDAPIKLKGDNLNQKAIMDYLREQMGGVNLHVRYKAPKDQKTSIQFIEPIATGAFLQFLEDELECVFVLRDYGIIVVPADERLPPGAVRVTDFWKHAKADSARESTRDRDVARTQVKVLTTASQAYYLKRGAWPPNLNTLLQKDKYGGPYLEDANAILDPWGKSYQYDIKGPKNNGTRPDIWAVAPDGTILGNWPEVRAP